MRRFDDTSVQGGFVAIVLKNVPAAEDEIVELSEGNEVLDARAVVICTLAQADGAVLGQGAYRSSQTLLNEFDPCNDRGTHCSHARQEHSQLPSGRRNRHLRLLHT